MREPVFLEHRNSMELHGVLVLSAWATGRAIMVSPRAPTLTSRIRSV